MKTELISTWAEARSQDYIYHEIIAESPALEPLAMAIVDRRAHHPEQCEYEVAMSLLKEARRDELGLSIAGYRQAKDARGDVVETISRHKREPRLRGIMWRYWQREKMLIADLLDETPPDDDDTREVWELIRKPEFMELHKRAATAATVVRLHPEDEPKPEKPSAKRGEWHLVPLSEVSDEPVPFRIAGMVPQEGITVIFGKPKSGKSFMAIDMASCVATRRDWHGNTVMPGKVVYIAGEGRSGIKARFRAWAMHNDADPMDNILISSGAAMIGVPTQLVTVAKGINAATNGEPPAMIVVDTLKRNFGPGNEDKGEDMSRFVAGLDRLRELFPGTTIVVVHHSGHHDDERAMGSINLLAAVDAEYRVKKTGKGRAKMECTNARDFDEPDGMEFEMAKVEGSLVPIYAGVATNKKARKPTKAETVGLDSYDAIPDDQKTDIGVQEEIWRGHFYDLYDASDDANEKAFQRARERLADNGQLFEIEGYCLVDVQADRRGQ